MKRRKSPDLLGGLALPALDAIEGAVHRDPSGSEADSFAAPGADARARPKSGLGRGRREKKLAFPKLAISCQFGPTRPEQSHRPCIELLYRRYSERF